MILANNLRMIKKEKNHMQKKVVSAMAGDKWKS
jgi:hypothetical protein